MKLMFLFIVHVMLLSDCFARKCNVKRDDGKIKAADCGDKQCCTKKITKPGKSTLLEHVCCYEGECDEQREEYKRVNVTFLCVQCNDKDFCNPYDPGNGATNIQSIGWTLVSSIIFRLVM